MTVRRVRAACYAGTGLLLLLCITSALPLLLPSTVARHVANDSEGYTLALLLAPWVELVRPRLRGRRVEWVVTAAAALACLLVGVLLYRPSGLVGSVRTLNETFVALALLIPYVQPSRRPRPPVAALLSVALVVLTVVLVHTPLAHLTNNLAEGVVMLILAPVALDCLDRRVLAPDAPAERRRQVAWWVALVALPLLFVVARHVPVGADLRAVATYGARAQEAFVGLLMLELYAALTVAVARRSRAGIEKHPAASGA